MLSGRSFPCVWISQSATAGTAVRENIRTEGGDISGWGPPSATSCEVEPLTVVAPGDGPATIPALSPTFCQSTSCWTTSGRSIPSATAFFNSSVAFAISSYAPCWRVTVAEIHRRSPVTVPSAKTAAITWTPWQPELPFSGPFTGPARLGGDSVRNVVSSPGSRSFPSKLRFCVVHCQSEFRFPPALPSLLLSHPTIQAVAGARYAFRR